VDRVDSGMVDSRQAGRSGTPQHSSERAGQLDVLRGSAKPVAGNARSIIALGANPRCGMRRVAQAARVDLGKVVAGTEFAMPSGQSPFALNKGNRWEKRLKEANYELLLALLREAEGLPVTEIRVRDLHAEFPFRRADPYWSLRERLAATREAVREGLSGQQTPLNLIDGAVLSVPVGGYLVYLELDGLAFREGGRYRVVEIKSFSVVDGRADPAKVAEAAQQAAVYVLALQNLVADLGYDRSLVHDEVFLIAARNVSLRPQLERLVVTSDVRGLRRRLGDGLDIEDLLARVTADDSFFGDGTGDERERLSRVTAIADRVGTMYEPACLSHCAMAWWCRDRAASSGSPQCLGGSVARYLPEVPTLTRALDLAAGASPAPAEVDAAQLLRRAATLYGRALGTPG
jgi:hypothetical protein